MGKTLNTRNTREHKRRNCQKRVTLSSRTSRSASGHTSENSSEELSTEINAAEMHMKLLSEHVWKHTIVLFACDEGVEETAIKEHIHSAEKILDKCGGRSHVLQRSACESPTQISELFKTMDNLVKKNSDALFIPQSYCELSQQKTQEVSGLTELSQSHRGSLPMSPPNSEYYFTKPTADLSYTLIY